MGWEERKTCAKYLSNSYTPNENGLMIFLYFDIEQKEINISLRY